MAEIPTHFLFPATLFVSARPHYISTILGSCVSVCLWDPVLKYGGMNHFMLPFWNGQGLATPKYGNIAIPRLIEKMQALGSKKTDLQAKVFGGGEVIDIVYSNFLIGERNIQVARDILKEEKLQIVTSSTGGKLGRKIIFGTETGIVKHRFIQKISLINIFKNQ